MSTRLKRALLTSGATRAWHRARNRSALTVVGLHRVLPDGDARWAAAMEEYSITTSVFEDLLDFLADHYSPVSLQDLLDAREGRARLPPRPALLTFDDGWSDTADVALPILEARRVPSVVFMVADRVDASEGFWQTEWWAALKTNPHDRVLAALEHLGVEDAPGHQEPSARLFHRVILALEDRPLEQRWHALQASGLHRPDLGPAMVSAGALARLPRRGMAVGGHGLTHEPMTRVASITREIEEAKASLQARLPPGDLAPALSFPHGRYSQDIVQTAHGCGYDLLFTSDQTLTPVSALRRDEGLLLGRVWAGISLLDEKGRLDAAKTIRRFFFSPIKRLTGIPDPPFDH